MGTTFIPTCARVHGTCHALNTTIALFGPWTCLTIVFVACQDREFQAALLQDQDKASRPSVNARSGASDIHGIDQTLADQADTLLRVGNGDCKAAVPSVQEESAEDKRNKIFESYARRGLG